jgi:dipeptidyl aminopeptidase/acylaminoacyl peptidase
MYDALHRAGKPVQLEVLATEDELFATRESRTVMLRKSMEFLRINNPPD